MDRKDLIHQVSVGGGIFALAEKKLVCQVDVKRRVRLVSYWLCHLGRGNFDLPAGTRKRRSAAFEKPILGGGAAFHTTFAGECGEEVHTIRSAAHLLTTFGVN